MLFNLILGNEEWGMGNGGKRGKTKFKREKRGKRWRNPSTLYIFIPHMLYCFVIPLNVFVSKLSIYLSIFLSFDSFDSTCLYPFS